jgi:thiamine-monophosphate kinase
MPGTQLAFQRHAGRGPALLPDVDPALTATRPCAVNLSDLAACGATAGTLALTCRRLTSLAAPFHAGLLGLADAHGCELIGGDTAEGRSTSASPCSGIPWSTASTACCAPAQSGGACTSVARWTTPVWRWRCCVAPGLPRTCCCGQAMDRPTPRCLWGCTARHRHAAIDVSDGAGRPQPIKASRSGPPCTDVVNKLIAQTMKHGLKPDPTKIQLQCVLAGGDDYELALPPMRDAVTAAALSAATPHLAVLRDAAAGLRLVNATRSEVPTPHLVRPLRLTLIKEGRRWAYSRWRTVGGVANLRQPASSAITPVRLRVPPLAVT